MEFYTLNNTIQLPCVGLGTWQITDRDRMAVLIRRAYEKGYRLIDTAAAYSNEIAIAKAIAAAGIDRKELLLSDKVWNTSRGYEAVQEACRKSLKKLKTDYLDIYLMHWPASKKLHPDWARINAETWRGMEKLCKDGYVRAIGVCNFKVHHLEELEKSAEIMPCINQFELHPGFHQDDLVLYCQEKSILVEASSPLGNGQILKHEGICGIAGRHDKSAAQICLRWSLQKGAAVIPKTADPDRLAQNIDVFDFSLSSEEMKELDDIPYCGGVGIDSDEVTEFG